MLSSYSMRVRDEAIGTSRRVTVAFFLVILASVGAGIVILVSQGGSARSVRNLSTAFMKEISARAQASTLSYLEAGPRSLEVVRQLVRDGRINLDGDADLERQFRALLSGHDEVEMLNFGQPNGDFMMVKRMPDSSLSTKRVRRQGDVALSFWEHDNDVWSREEAYAARREPATAAYDPRTRPWYRLASETGRLSWIEPYVFFTDKRPGIACALPLYGDARQLAGVIGADIGIADLSRLLGTLSIGRTGRASILTADGRLIAHPDFERQGFGFAREIGGTGRPEVELWRVEDSPDAVLGAAFGQRPAAGAADSFTFDHQDAGYVARFESFPISSDRQWVVGVMAPQGDFMGSLSRDHTLTLTVTLACLVLAIGLAAVLVRRADGLEIELLEARTVEKQQFIEELETRNAEMERFTYTVSHDLKSPLITIRGFLGVLEKDLKAGQTERVKDDIERINSAAGTMARLLDELLELSRIGRVVNAPEEVALVDLAREAAEHLAGVIGERDVEIVIAPELPVVRGDRPRLFEVLQNLIENAVKFMGDEPRPRVEIGHRPGGGEAVFFVRDNGIGIGRRYHEKIFGLFDRLDLTIDGTGIGLALVKRIVETHGGRIWVESEDGGGGSTFCFTLPRGDADSSAAGTTGTRISSSLVPGGDTVSS